ATQAMAPKAGNKRSTHSTAHGSGRSKGAGVPDGRKSGKGASGGAGAEGGAMTTAVIQKKMVGGVSPGVELQVRTLLQKLMVQAAQPPTPEPNRCGSGAFKGDDSSPSGSGSGPPPPVAAAADARTLAGLSALWEQLAGLGFGAEAVKRVVAEGLPRGQPASLDAALDWLCLYLPPAELPYRFKSAGGGGGGGGAPVRILAVAAAAQQQPQQQEQEQAV
ncbi:hypothetical protein Agub_g4349, partial [Astrephomene gubernaculifera]